MDSPRKQDSGASQDNLEGYRPTRSGLSYPEPAYQCGCGDGRPCLKDVRTKKVDYVPTGKVKWYDKEKGFGFLAGEDGQEVFLPKSSLPEGITELKAGTRVEFGVADGRKGAQALGLRVLDKTPSIAKAKRPSARDLAPLVQDLVSVLDNLSGTLSAGKYPEGNKGKAIAAALRKVADELDV